MFDELCTLRGGGQRRCDRGRRGLWWPFDLLRARGQQHGSGRRRGRTARPRPVERRSALTSSITLTDNSERFRFAAASRSLIGGRAERKRKRLTPWRGWARTSPRCRVNDSFASSNPLGKIRGSMSKSQRSISSRPVSVRQAKSFRHRSSSPS